MKPLLILALLVLVAACQPEVEVTPPVTEKPLAVWGEKNWDNTNWQ